MQEPRTGWNPADPSVEKTGVLSEKEAGNLHHLWWKEDHPKNNNLLTDAEANWLNVTICFSSCSTCKQPPPSQFEMFIFLVIKKMLIFIIQSPKALSEEVVTSALQLSVQFSLRGRRALSVKVADSWSIQMCGDVTVSTAEGTDPGINTLTEYTLVRGRCLMRSVRTLLCQELKKTSLLSRHKTPQNMVLSFEASEPRQSL